MQYAFCTDKLSAWNFRVVTRLKPREHPHERGGRRKSDKNGDFPLSQTGFPSDSLSPLSHPLSPFFTAVRLAGFLQLLSRPLGRATRLSFLFRDFRASVRGVLQTVARLGCVRSAQRLFGAHLGLLIQTNKKPLTNRMGSGILQYKKRRGSHGQIFIVVKITVA